MNKKVETRVWAIQGKVGGRGCNGGFEFKRLDYQQAFVTMLDQSGCFGLICYWSVSKVIFI